MSRRLLLLAGVVAALAVLSGPLLSQEQPGKRYAILVGVKAYNHAALPDLEYTERDVEELAALLEPAGYKVTLLTTSAGERDEARRPTLANIRRALAAVLKDVTKHDTVLIGLAGHGVQPDGGKESYFCPLDAKPKDPKTLVPLAGLIDELTDSGAGVKLLLVDACRNDPDPGRGRGVDGSRVEALPKGVAALFSCSAGQRAFETKKAGGGHGVFFHFVLEGLRGQAGKNDRGELTWSRLVEYVQENVEARVPEWIGGEARQVPHEVKNVAGRSPVLLRTDDEVKHEPARAVAPFDAERARALQQEWADHLRRKVVETVDLGGGATLELVLIPPGVFTMGSPGGEQGRFNDEFNDEGPAHEVELTKPFWIGRFEVTRGQFRRFVDAAEYKTEAEKDGKGGGGYDADKQDFFSDSKYTWRSTGFAQTDEHPVVNVSSNDAMAFCAWLGRKTGGKVRLPTEAEWEYSCRAGTTTRFSGGDSDTSLRRVANIADLSLKAKWDYSNLTNKEFQKILKEWFDEVSWDDGYAFTAPVGQFRANAFGLYDMHGNAWEWCADWYGKYSEGRLRDPEGAAAGSFRVLRGGGFDGAARNCRSAFRSRVEPAVRFLNLGFRVVLVR
jgi:formylglycine-generating enzyme required for sulfatase activity